MTIEDRLRVLARSARNEPPPSVDVADRVVRVLLAREQAQISLPERTWMWMAGLSVAVAATVLVVAIPFYEVWNDPFIEVVETISWVIQ
jgi:hypothetical protein